MSSERGGIVTGWLFKLVLSLAVVGVVAFEAGAIVVARVTVEDVAGDVAGEAAEVFGRERDDRAALDAARRTAETKGAVVERFAVIEDGNAVEVTVSKEAKTLLLHRIGPTEKWAVARSTRRRGVS